MKDFLNQGGGIVLYSTPLRQYFTGFHSSFGIAVITAENTFLICDDRYIESAEKRASAHVIKYTPTALETLLKELKFTKTGIVPTHMTAKEYIELTALADNITDVSKEIFNVTSVKTQTALKNIKKACSIAENAFRKSILQLKEGMTEKGFARILEQNMTDLGADGVSFETIVAFGRNSSVPHHSTGLSKLKNNMPVLVDFGCKVNGWCSDMTRTFYFGKPDRKYLDAYINVLNVHENCAVYIKKGKNCGYAHDFAKNLFRINDLHVHFTHSLGHGLGLEIHEEPYLRENSENYFQENCVFTIEPGVYFKGRFGIRIENTYVIENSKAVSLMRFTKNPIYIEDGKIKTVKTYKTIINK